MLHQDVYSQYVFQEPSKACRLSEPVNMFEDKIYHQNTNNSLSGYILYKYVRIIFLIARNIQELTRTVFIMPCKNAIRPLRFLY